VTRKNPLAPTAANPFKKNLEALKQKLTDEEQRVAANAKAKQEADKAKGILETPKRSAPQAPPQPARPKGSSVEVWRPADLDQRLFEVAMSGVAPLNPTQGGRVPARAPDLVPAKRQAPEVRERQKRAEGGAEINAVWTPDGRVRGAHRGREFALEALERFASPDESLDLHKLDPVTAKLRVAEFVRTRRARGMRCVCVITGYGKNSPDGASVLLDAAVEALRVAPAAGEIDAFASAPDDLGGRGAILISLRNS
jgi:DNA-nicking Smr family endonuclease